MAACRRLLFPYLALLALMSLTTAVAQYAGEESGDLYYRLPGANTTLTDDAVTIATGGLAGLIFDHAPSLDRLDPMLTLRGLQIIHRRNHP